MARPKKKKGDETESPELPLENGEGTPPPENGEKAAPAAGGGDENRGNIVSTDIENEMKDSYLDYAMSVIVGRALAGRARRLEARPPPHLHGHARPLPHLPQTLPQIGQGHRRRHG